MPWEDDDVDETFSSPLPQEDRLWRHPAEVAAAARAAAASAPPTAATPPAPDEATVTVQTMRTPVRQAVGLATVGAACGALIVTGLFVGLRGGGGVTVANDPVTQSVAMQPVVALPVVVDAEDWPSTVAASVDNAVVSVIATHGTRVQEGSAVVFRSDGLLLTSHDLVDGADKVAVTMGDGAHYAGDVLGTDHISGLAVVRIDSSDLEVGHLGIFTPAPRHGEPTVVVGGNMASDELSMATINGTDVSVPFSDTSGLHGMLELGSALPDGASGAAVVDQSGAIIAIALDVGGDNTTYAVPIAFARKIAEDLMLHGEGRHPWIGIRGVDVGTDLQAAHRILGGVEITEVLDGPAVDAGLRAGDMLLSLDDATVNSMTELIVGLRTHPPGQTLEIAFLRDGERHTGEVTLALRPLGDADGGR